jgi:hypothetical protein
MLVYETMKKRQNSDPQGTATQEYAGAAPKRRMSVVRAVGATAGLAAAAGLVLGVGSAVEHGSHKPPKTATATANYPKFRASYVKSLDGELRTAYVGPVALNEAEVTNRIVTDDIGEKRGVIKIHIGGAAINAKTAKSTGDPGYYYATEPIETVTIDGNRYSGEVHWTDQKDGDAEMNPVLGNFSGSKPVTYDYQIGLGAYGLVPGSPAQGASGIREIDATYNAGEVAVTGEDGKITSVQVIPRSAEVPAVQITEPRS